jgi:electron transfer flavoprotein alpha subunit
MQMVTVRPGVLTAPAARRPGQPDVEVRVAQSRGRIRHLEEWRNDEVGLLSAADAVVGVGAGVFPHEYPALVPLLEALGAELGATRKVTDNGWMPRARQIGLTGQSVGPRLYVAIAVSGKFNHMIGVRSAGYIVAINREPNAPVFDGADLGLVGDWHEIVPALVDELAREGGVAASA